jgi:hypothetical protein
MDALVRGMLKNSHLARSVADMSFFEFRRQLEYKAAMRGLWRRRPHCSDGRRSASGPDRLLPVSPKY